MTTTMTITILIIAALIGLFLVWRHGAKCYDAGMHDAIVLHENGRLKYETYLDDDGSTKINIEIDN